MLYESIEDHGAHGMSQKILSVSIAAYNSEKYLERCVRSFTESGVISDTELIIVDDGSTDNTGVIADRLHFEHPDDIKVIHKKNGGHGSTINASIKEASGKYFKIVDSDDWVEKSGIEKLIDILKKTECDIVLNPHYDVDALTGKKCQSEDVSNGNPYNRIMDIDFLDKDIFLAMHDVCFRTDVLKNAGEQIDEKCFYVDAEYIIYYFYHCRNTIFLEFPVYDYYVGTKEQSMNHKNMVRRRKEHEQVVFSVIDFYEKHYGSATKTDRKQKIIRNRINMLIRMQYKILMLLSYDQAKVELRGFDDKLRSKSEVLYGTCLDNDSKRRFIGSRILKILRKDDFRHFRLLNTVWRKKYS